MALVAEQLRLGQGWAAWGGVGRSGELGVGHGLEGVGGQGERVAGSCELMGLMVGWWDAGLSPEFLRLGLHRYTTPFHHPASPLPSFPSFAFVQLGRVAHVYEPVIILSFWRRRVTSSQNPASLIPQSSLRSLPAGFGSAIFAPGSGASSEERVRALARGYASELRERLAAELPRLPIGRYGMGEPRGRESVELNAWRLGVIQGRVGVGRKSCPLLPCAPCVWKAGISTWSSPACGARPHA